MGMAIGIAEFKSIAKGVEMLDMMTKRAAVKIVDNRAICVGKFFVIISGDVADVSAAIDAVTENSGPELVGAKVIPSLADGVAEKINAQIDTTDIGAIGIVETKDINTGLYCANYIKKSSQVTILRISIQFGMGGKAVVLFTGDVASVNNGIEVAKEKAHDSEKIIAAVAIPSPSKELVSNLFKPGKF
jgi:microcompartment protein CcmL/EutN